jgi:hypothetical protein
MLIYPRVSNVLYGLRGVLLPGNEIGGGGGVEWRSFTEWWKRWR